MDDTFLGCVGDVNIPSVSCTSLSNVEETTEILDSSKESWYMNLKDQAVENLMLKPYQNQIADMKNSTVTRASITEFKKFIKFIQDSQVGRKSR